jgi:U4/U6.U5 tri-snRNP-associated protein 1
MASSGSGAGAPGSANAEGEISLSIEETNKLRISLGLKPLQLGSSGKVGSDKAPVHIDLEARREADEAKARLERVKRQREEEAAFKGRGLGEVLKEQKLSAADWVRLSRAKEQQAAAKAAAAGGASGGAGGSNKRARTLAMDSEEDGALTAAGSGLGRAGRASAGSGKVKAAYGAADMAGMKIHHSAADFAEGEAAILTLKDTGVLDEEGDDPDGGGGNELINADLSEKERAAELAERKRRAAGPVYSSVDAGDASGYGPDGRPRLLAQYDEEAEYRARQRAAALVIKADGTVDDLEAADKKRAREAAAAAAAGKTMVDLNEGLDAGGGLRLASDYYTAAELAARAAGRPKKKKALRKAAAAAAAEAAEDGAAAPAGARAAAGAATGTSSSIIADIKSAAALTGDDASGERDRGSRKERGAIQAERAAAEAAEAAAKQRAYDAAVDKANARSAALLKGAPASASSAAAGDAAAAAAAALEEGRWLTNPSVAPAVEPVGTVHALSRQRIYARLREGPAAGATEEDAMAEDDDAELVATLAKARRMAKLAASASSSAPASGPVPVGGVGVSDRAPLPPAAAAAGEAAAGAAGAAGAEDREDARARQLAALVASESASEPAAEGGGGGGGMVLTATTEFSRQAQLRQIEAIHTRLQQGQGGAAAAPSGATASNGRAPLPAADTVMGGTQSPVSSSAALAARAAAERLQRDRHRAKGPGAAGGAWASKIDAGILPAIPDDAPEAADTEEGDEDVESLPSDEEEEEEPDADYLKGARLNRGAGSALLLLQQLGGLSAAPVQISGRKKDPKPQMDTDAGTSQIGPNGREIVAKLEYRDEDGRPLTAKESFRRLSYAFHGHKPSQKVRERRNRAAAREKRVLYSSSTDTPLGSLAALQRTQEATGQAHVVLSRR